MVELVDNPIKVGNPPPRVARVFVALAQRTNATKVLANKILCEWQIQLKMKQPNPETKCPWYQPAVQSMKLRGFLSRLKTRYGWQMSYADDFRGYEGSLSAVLKQLYREREQKWDGYAVKRKNCIKAEDRHKVRLDIFDESDHNQHIEKCITGSGIYFGFRGAKEHTMLKVEDASIGNYPKGSNFEGYLYFAVANLVDKTHALSAENGYRRDTTTLMKVPILSDDPASGDHGGTMKRMLEKAFPNQKRLYHQMKKNGTLSLVVIGENKIRDLHKSAARRMGVSSDSFRGGHAWRVFFVTNLVNAKGVSTAESMAAARHTSVSAHVAYQETDFISEGNRTLALLQSNDPSSAQEFIHKKNSKHNQAVQKSQPFASSIFDESSPEDTSLNCSELELNHDETASSAYQDYQELVTNHTLSKSDTYEFMHKSQDSTAADEEDYTSCHDKMPLYDCSARDRCDNTEPMNTQQERERTVNDYEMRFSDIEKNYNFNHEYGDWYDSRKGDGKRKFY